jgi:hypothetical protein
MRLIRTPLRWFLSVIVVGSGIAAAVLVMRPPTGTQAQVTSDCSVASLSGTYGSTATGMTGLGPYSVPLPDGARANMATVGQFQFDGRGGLTGADRRSTDGALVARVYTGAYTVLSDCTGIMTITLTAGSPEEFAFVLVDGGRQLHALAITPGEVVTVHATKL